MTTYPPTELVKYAAAKLEDLCHEIVFLGGAVVGLLITEPGSRAPRPTQDVDATVQISTITEYYALNEVLLSKGFANDMNGPICRYVHGLLKLDVMPASPNVLGFTNRWYGTAIETAQPYTFQGGPTINLIAAPVFLATKIEAFNDPNREGNHDTFISRDFADVVSVIDGRPSITNEVLTAPSLIQEFLRDGLMQLLKGNYLEDAIAEHIDQGREEIVIARLKAVVNS